MTKFNFSDGESLELNNSQLENKNIIKIGKNESSTTLTIRNYLLFILNNSLVPQLPANIQIKYVDESKSLQFFVNIAEKFKIKQIGNFNVNKNKYPDDYAYPASMNPDTSTLYVSKDFNKTNKKLSKIKKSIETNEIVLFRSYFNQDNQKALEYTFGHELGHFFLLSKNALKPELDENKFIQKIAMNIEEGFAEAFSIQLMYLKNPEFSFDTVKEGRHHDSAIKLKNKTDQSVSSNQRLDYFTRFGFEKLIDTYNFKTIYDNLPIKDKNGSIEQNIDKIYTECLEIAKNNNKEVLKDIINNETFKHDGLINSFNYGLKDSIKSQNNNIYEVIEEIQKKITGMSFNTAKIKNLREKFLNIKNDTTYKPT